MASVMLFADAGPGIGLGHLHRSLALAAALRHHVPCVVATLDDAGIRDRVRAAGCLFAPQPVFSAEATAHEVGDTVALAREYECRTIVVDSYAAAAGFLAGLRASGLRVVVLDDLAREPMPVQVVVNGGAQAPALPYVSSTGDTVFLLGPAYAMLQPAFWDLPPRRIAGDVRHVLVTVGGDDTRNVTADLLGCLDRTSGDFDVRAVVGPFSSAGRRVDEAARDSRRVVSVVRGVTSLRDLIAEADVAISAAGQTLYELAAAGTPTIAFELFDNQADNLEALAAAGVVRSAGRVSDPGFHDRLAVLIDSLILDAGARAGLSAAGQRLVDGRGAARVAAAVVALR